MAVRRGVGVTGFLGLGPGSHPAPPCGAQRRTDPSGPNLHPGRRPESQRTPSPTPTPLSDTSECVLDPHDGTGAWQGLCRKVPVDRRSGNTEHLGNLGDVVIAVLV